MDEEETKIIDDLSIARKPNFDQLHHQQQQQQLQNYLSRLVSTSSLSNYSQALYPGLQAMYQQQAAANLSQLHPKCSSASYYPTVSAKGGQPLPSVSYQPIEHHTAKKAEKPPKKKRFKWVRDLFTPKDKEQKYF